MGTGCKNLRAVLAQQHTVRQKIIATPGVLDDADIEAAKATQVRYDQLLQALARANPDQFIGLVRQLDD